MPLLRVPLLALAAAAPLAAARGDPQGEPARHPPPPPSSPPVIRVVPPPETSPGEPAARPAPAASGEAVRPAPPRPPSGPAEGSRATRPAPPRGSAPVYHYPPSGYPGYGYPVYPPPFWWGWSWGYGYYPLYPRPPEPVYQEQVRRVTTSLTVAAGASREHLAMGGHTGFSGSIDLAVEGQVLGFHAGVSGFGLDQGYGYDWYDAFGLATAHLTVAILSADFFRVRAEIGASIASWPATFFAREAYAFGPDLGLSARLGLIGPLGVEAYGRVTPFPREVVDAGGGLAVRFAPLALTFGWRHTYVDGSPTYPSFRFDGPQVGLSILF